MRQVQSGEVWTCMARYLQVGMSQPWTLGQMAAGTQVPAPTWCRYTVLTGVPPFVAAPLSEMYQNIRAGHYPEPAHLSPNARRLIARLLAPNPAERPSLDHLLQDDFFTQVGGVRGRGPPWAALFWGVSRGPQVARSGVLTLAPHSKGLHPRPAASPLLPQPAHLHHPPASEQAFPEGGPPAADPVPATL